MEQCQRWVKTKLKNFPFKSNDNRAKQAFELVRMDTVAINDESLHGNMYFLSILNDYSGFGWILFLSSKVNFLANLFLGIKVLKIILIQQLNI